MAADNIHALLGSLLIAMVVAGFFYYARRSPPLCAVEVRALSRRLSRMVYLSLFLAAGLEQIAGRGPELRRDGLFLLGCGLISLILIRVLALGWWLRKSQQSPQQQPKHQYVK